jgi:hypothetical protein
VDVEDAEAMTILEGLHFADRWPSSVKVIMETDCSNLISKVTTIGEDRSTTSVRASDIKEALRRRLECSIQKVVRDCNKIAHNLVQLALETYTSKTSFSFVPPYIQDLVYNDRSRCWDSGVVAQ